MMAEIKVQSRLVKEVGEGRAAAFARPARVEFVYLQFRKILELIAMGSLLATSQAFGQVQSKIQRYWNAKDLLKDIQGINPDFYPRRIISEAEFSGPGVKMEWLGRSDDYLGRIRFFLSFRNQRSSLLHEN